MLRVILAVLFVITSCLGYTYEQDLLKTQDISRIMQQILSEHIDKKQMTNQVLQRSLVIYINQFDPHRMYLLEQEILPYVKLSPEAMEQAIEEYKKNHFTLFIQLNEMIQHSIQRSRRIRKELEADVKEIFLPSNLSQLNSKKNSETLASFSKDEAGLKERTLENLANYIDIQKSIYGKAMNPKKKERILNSYEIKLRDFENQYLFQDNQGNSLLPVEQENLFAIHILKALAHSLDSHTSFYEANEAYDMRVRLQKEFKGIGLVLKDTSHGVMVTHMLEDGPAAKSKLIQTEDILTEIDGKSIVDDSFEKVMEMLHGEKNTNIKLTFKRKQSDENSDKIYTVELKREIIILNNDRVDTNSEFFGDGIIGIIKLYSFYQGEGVSSEQDIKDAIETLRKKGNLKGLILDLRDNGGGFLSQAVKVAGLFITDGVIVISKYSNGNERIYRDVDGKATYDGPLIVLTSKATASAAEIVAQALQDYGVALIVGDEHTYGKGTIQSQTVTDNKGASYFKVTVGKYYTVSGRTPQKEGVKADVIVPGHWNREQIGEMYTHSLGSDVIPSAYQDSLQDIPLDLRSWYIKYYIPKLQKRLIVWHDLLPILQKNSSYRITNNKNYQYFLKGESTEEENSEEEWSVTDKKNKTYGEDDLQVQEAVNILKDMILLHHKEQNAHTQTVE